MAHTNQTPNYALSQFLGTDKPAWLVDYNGDMEKIDLGLKAAKDVADAAKEEADQGALDIAAVTVTANSADAKATGAISNTADVYDATSTYNVGDFVIYNNILYRCITNIAVPESFDGAHWERTSVEEIIVGVNATLDQVNSDLNNSLYTERALNVYGNGTTITTVNTPIITGYTPIGVVGMVAIGDAVGVTSIFEYTATPSITTIKWTNAMPNTYGVQLIIGYIKNKVAN